MKDKNFDPYGLAILLTAIAELVASIAQSLQRGVSQEDIEPAGSAEEEISMHKAWAKLQDAGNACGLD